MSIEPTRIVGICGGCGRSIRPDRHYVSTAMVSPFYGLGAPPPTLYLCADCIKGLADLELKWREQNAPEGK